MIILMHLLLLQRLRVPPLHYVRLSESRMARLRARPAAVIVRVTGELGSLEVRLPRYVRLHNRRPSTILIVVIIFVRICVVHCQRRYFQKLIAVIVILVIELAAVRFLSEVADLRFHFDRHLRINIRRVIDIMRVLRRADFDFANRVVKLIVVLVMVVFHGF